MSDLTGKIALVTGSASGIGRASAIRLAHDGADVALLDINGRGIEETAEEIRALGRNALPIATDLLDRDSIDQALTQIRQELGAIGILHNNAGGSTHYKDKRGFVNASSDQWDQIVGLNLRAVADCTRATITDMKEKGSGRVIITASEMAFRGGPGFTEYSSAKAGVLGFTRSLAIEVGKYGITVNAICPGVIRTPALDSFPEEAVQATIAEIPMQRLGEPEDIANAVSFLASDQASYVTGTSMLVTGGRTMH